MNALRLGRRAFVVALKELAASLASPLGLVAFVAFSGFASWYAIQAILGPSRASLRPFFDLLPVAFLFVAPAISMRLLSEERKLGTLELLLTWPLDDLEIIVGKHLGALGFLSLSLVATTLPLWAFAAWLGDVDSGPVIAGLLGGVLLGAVYLAIGLLASSLTENQVVAFVLTVVMIAPLWILGLEPVRKAIDPALLPMTDALALSRRFESIARGVVDLRDLVYFLAIVAVFLAATARVLSARRWSSRLQTIDAFTATAASIAIGAVLVSAFDERPARKDLTAEGIYSLSSATRSVLDSIEDPCRVIGYFSAKLPPEMQDRRRRVQDLMADVDAISRGKVRFEERDPQDPEVAAEVGRLGIQRVTMTQRSRGEMQAIEGYFSMAVLYRDRKETIPFVGEPRELEHDLVATLRALDLPREKTVALLAPRAPAAPSAAARLVADRLKQRRLDVVFWHQGDRPPDTASALVVIDPRNLSERDAWEIDQAVMRNVPLLVASAPYDVDQGLTAHAIPTGLEQVLDAWGAGFDRGIVRERGPSRQESIAFRVGNKPVEGPCLFAPRVPRSELADHPAIGLVSELCFPFAGPIARKPIPGVTSTVLARASDKADVRDWDGALFGEIEKLTVAVAKGETLEPERKRTISPVLAVALRGPLPSAFKGRPAPAAETAVTGGGLVTALSDTGAPESEREPLEGAKDARVVVIGSTAMLDPDMLRFLTGSARRRFERNAAFVVNSVDWLLDETELIGLRGRDTAESPVRQVGHRSLVIAQGWVYSVPVAAVLAALARAVRKRRRRTAVSAGLRELLPGRKR